MEAQDQDKWLDDVHAEPLKWEWPKAGPYAPVKAKEVTTHPDTDFPDLFEVNKNKGHF